jgi:Uma2 family endonuclease
MSAHSESALLTPKHPPKRGEPAWDIALLFPAQGQWSEEEYLSLCDGTNWLIELNDGVLEVLPMPVVYHQRIVQFLFEILKAFVVAARAGEVFVAPLPIRLWEEQMREPDVVFVRPGRITDPRETLQRADLVIEVVSPGKESRKRDLKDKPQVYAKAGIAEYWIVDPEKRTISVLQLKGKKYAVHGAFKAPSQATSVLLRGLAIDVATVFAAGEKGPV